jgi:hypothetical protein
MKTTSKILSIGDIHGRSIWKDKLFGSFTEFERWAYEVESGAGEVLADLYPISTYDKIIFIGDYVDSFTIGNAEMLRNLEDIVLVKRTFPDKVILLLGNHDVQYIKMNLYCSGYRPEMRFDFNRVFNANLDLFKIAHYEELHNSDGRSLRKILWTHAGVTQGWLDILNETFDDQTHRHYEIMRDNKNSRIDQKLNLAWELGLGCLHNVDSSSGGSSQWAGPLWVRPSTLCWENFPGVDQIVGHTPRPKIVKQWSPDTDVESNPEARDLIVIIDCLEHGNGEYYEIEYEL